LFSPFGFRTSREWFTDVRGGFDHLCGTGVAGRKKRKRKRRKRNNGVERK
jgi:hypothetical protein